MVHRALASASPASASSPHISRSHRARFTHLALQVLVTATARTLDLATAYVMPSQVLLTASPSMKQPLLERMDKYIFPADNVQVGWDKADDASWM
jgi:folate-binding Fe-S cluster repair protein YgfZ